MKFTKLTIAFLSVFFCLVVACGSDGINDDPKTPDVTEPPSTDVQSRFLVEADDRTHTIDR